MQLILRFFRAAPTVLRMDTWLGAGILILLFLASLAYVASGGAMPDLEGY
jgi:hypothetical protein